MTVHRVAVPALDGMAPAWALERLGQPLTVTRLARHVPHPHT
jgi:hypothetical protein